MARYRMLETVREFGTLRLAESGERQAALAAQSAWAVDLATALGDAAVRRRPDRAPSTS